MNARDRSKKEDEGQEKEQPHEIQSAGHQRVVGWDGGAGGKGRGNMAA